MISVRTPTARREALPLPSAGLLAAVALAGLASPAVAAQCGDGLRPCNCDDVVVVDLTMTADLVCATPYGLRVTPASAAGVVIDGNGHSITMSGAGSHGVRIANADGATVRNLTVTTAAGAVRGVEVVSSSDVVLEDNVLSGLDEGVWAGGGAGTDPGLVLRGNDLSGSQQRGATLLGATSDLVLEANDFTGSVEAILLRDLVGPWTLDAADGNVFTDVSRNDDETDIVIALQRVSDVTLDGLDVSTDPSFPDSYHDGVGVRIAGSTGVTVSNCDLSGRYRGIDSTHADGGATLNSDGHLVGNDVSDADHYGMQLADWTDLPELANDVFDDCHNGLRISDIALATPAELDLGTCSFDNVGETFSQAALRIVRTSNVVLRHFEANVVARSTGIEVQDSADIEIAEALLCGDGRVGVDLSTGAAGTGSDRTTFGATGDVYLQNRDGTVTNPGANVSISALSDDTDLGTTIVSGDPDFTLNDLSLTTTGTLTRVGVPGWAFDDSDVDTCNNRCDDGADADGDTVCDDGDFGNPTTVLTRGAVPWVPNGSGVGSPTVVFDATANLWLMIFESMTAAPDATCEHGRWALGMATSLNGVNWNAAPSPILTPAASTPYACVAAQPTVVNNGGVNTIWFKAEDETGYRGVGRMVAQWNGVSFGITAPDPTVVLTEERTFGYLHGVFDTTLSGFGGYRFLLARFPSIYATSGGNTTPLAPLTGPLLQPGFGAGWSSDEAFNPGVACGRGGSGWTMFAGGRDTTPITTGYDIDAQYLGRLESSDFTSWSRIADAPALSTAAGDPEHRHWDVLPIGEGDYVVFFDDQGGAGGSNRIRAEVTRGLAWTTTVAAEVGTKVCTP